jgi:hypothetical protein
VKGREREKDVAGADLAAQALGRRGQLPLGAHSGRELQVAWVVDARGAEGCGYREQGQRTPLRRWPEAFEETGGADSRRRSPERQGVDQMSRREVRRRPALDGEEEQRRRQEPQRGERRHRTPLAGEHRQPDRGEDEEDGERETASAGRAPDHELDLVPGLPRPRERAAAASDVEAAGEA